MAGDWIKMRTNLWDDPRVSKLCDLTGQGEAAIVGGLYWLWATADQHTEDGVLLHLTLRQIDRKTGISGFGDALVAAGWLSFDGEIVSIPNFEDHNGASAKKRSQTAKRVGLHRAAAADVTRDDDSCNAAGVTPALAREEKRREEEEKACVASVPLPTADSSPALPACPAEKLVELYHEVLPELPRVRLMPADRRKALQKRWRWVLTSRKSDGTPRACTADEAMGWMRQFFERTRDNDFLMGRTGRGAGHEGWQCDLDHLLSDKGLKAVVEKTAAAA